MYLNDSSQILVILLTAVLIVFLIVGIILLIKLVQVVSKVKKISDQVETTTKNIHDVVAGVKSVVTPAVVTKAITGWIEKLTSEKKEKK